MAETKKEENKNLVWYEQMAVVPKEAQKPISAGRLKGMTDINPMWRIEKLTEIFGPVGIGWYTELVNSEILEGANNEKIVRTDINLYVKENGEWSKPIFGTGGSSFVAKESKGLYTSDECFKMAYTDALSVACKALGMGAKVYWGDSKYAKKTDDKPELASKAQVDLLEKIYKDHQDKKKELLDKYKWSSFADMPKKVASDLIKKHTAKKEQ